MEIWHIIVIVLAFVIYVLFENFKNKNAEKYRMNITLFSPKQMKEFLKQHGPDNVADAFEIFKGDYDYGWNNVLKAASIFGDATGADQDAAVQQLISNLGNDEPNLVAISAISLGKLKDPLAIPHLKKLLSSPPSQRELDRQKSLLFEKSQQESYARRIGATLTNYPKIPDPHEQHKKIKEAAAWALSEILQADLKRKEKISSKQSMEVFEAFEVFNNPKFFSLDKVIQAAAVLANATGTDIPKAVQYLTANLTHTNSNLVIFSVISLGKIGDYSIVSHLNKLRETTPVEQVLLRNAILSSINEITERIA